MVLYGGTILWGTTIIIVIIYIYIYFLFLFLHLKQLGLCIVQDFNIVGCMVDVVVVDIMSKQASERPKRQM